MAAMSSTGTMTCSSSGLRAPASTIVDLAIRRRRRRGTAAIVSSGRCVADSPIRWRLGGVRARAVARRAPARSASSRSRLRARWAPRFEPGDRVDLVDDDVLDVAEHLAGRAGEHEVERFGGGDQDVRRVAGDLAAILGRGVAGPAGDRDVRRLGAEPRGRERDAGQRRAEVALDVVGQRLERRDVQDADRCPGLSRVATGLGSVASRSRHHRNAARVLPLPVGAWMSVCRPLAMAAQPRGLRVASAPRSWPGTRPGRRARRARAGRRRRRGAATGGECSRDSTISTRCSVRDR